MGIDDDGGSLDAAQTPRFSTFSGALMVARWRMKVDRQWWSLGVQMGSPRVLVGNKIEAF